MLGHTVGVRPMPTWLLVACVLLGPCGGSKASSRDLAKADELCKSVAARVAPGGQLQLVVPQTVREVRFVEPAAFSNRSAGDHVAACSWTIVGDSRHTPSTVCKDGSRVVPGVERVISVWTDASGTVVVNHHVSSAADPCGSSS
jgi:hypothetical protein